MKGLRADGFGHLSLVVFGGFPSMKGVRVDDFGRLHFVGTFPCQTVDSARCLGMIALGSQCPAWAMHSPYGGS